MRIKLKDTLTNELMDAQILSVKKLTELPEKKDGWKFNWRQLFKVGGYLFKVVLEEKPEEIQGIMKFSVMNDEMVYLENIEAAPHNYGSKGKYDFVAGCLIAWCCKQSMSLGKGNYEGYVVFDSKTALIGFYQNKYRARLLGGQRMYFSPEAGQKLIDKYLKSEQEE